MAMITYGEVTVPDSTPSGAGGLAIFNDLKGLSDGNRRSKTLYVDATYGVDGTGVRGRASKPYLTIAAAVAAAQFGGSGDCIVVRPGNYAEDNLCKTGGAKSVTTSSTIARVSSVVTVPVGAAHGISVGDRFWLVATNVPTSGLSFIGEHVVSAVASTTISFYQDGPDESVATTANDRVLRPLSFYFMPGTVIGYPSDLTRTAGVFDTNTTGINAAAWTIVRGYGVFRHTYKIIDSAAIGDRMDFECQSARHTGANGLETMGLGAKNGWYNVKAFSDIANDSYDSIIIAQTTPGVRWCSVDAPIVYGNGAGGNGFELAGIIVDLRIKCDNIASYSSQTDAAINVQSATTVTRGFITVNGQISGNGGPAIDYQASGSTTSVQISAGEIISTQTNAISMNGRGLTLKNARIKSLKNDADAGAAISYAGATAAPFLALHNVVLVSHASATYSIASGGAENTVKVYGTCVANKAVETDVPATSGIIQQVGTVTVDSNVS